MIKMSIKKNRTRHQMIDIKHGLYIPLHDYNKQTTDRTYFYKYMKIINWFPEKPA